MTKKSETKNHSDNENEKAGHSNGRSRRGIMHRGNKSGHSFAAGFSWGEVDDEDQPEMLIPAKKKKRRKNDAEHSDHYPSTLSAVHSTPAMDPYPIADKKSWTVPRLTSPAEKPKLTQENDLSLPSYGRPLIDQEEDEFIKRLLKTADEEEDLDEKQDQGVSLGKRRKKSRSAPRKSSVNTNANPASTNAVSNENADMNLIDKNKKENPRRLKNENPLKEKSNNSGPKKKAERPTDSMTSGFDGTDSDSSDFENRNAFEDLNLDGTGSERKQSGKFYGGKNQNPRSGASQKRSVNITTDDRSESRSLGENSSPADENTNKLSLENSGPAVRNTQNKRSSEQASRKRSAKASKAGTDSFEKEENLSKENPNNKSRKANSDKSSNRGQTPISGKDSVSASPLDSETSAKRSLTGEMNSGNKDGNFVIKSALGNNSGQTSDTAEDISKNELLSLRSRSLRLLKKSGISSESLDNLARTKNLSPVQLLRRFLTAILDINSDAISINANAEKFKADSKDDSATIGTTTIETENRVSTTEAVPMKIVSNNNTPLAKSNIDESNRGASDLFETKAIETDLRGSGQAVPDQFTSKTFENDAVKFAPDSTSKEKTSSDKIKTDRPSLDIPFGDIKIEKTAFIDLAGDDRRNDLSPPDSKKRPPIQERDDIVPEKKIIPVSEDPAITVWEAGFSKKITQRKSPTENLNSEKFTFDSEVPAKIPTEATAAQAGSFPQKALSANESAASLQQNVTDPEAGLQKELKRDPKSKKNKSRIKSKTTEKPSAELSKKKSETGTEEFHFGDLKLSRTMLEALHNADYDSPTPVQAGTFDRIMAGKDLIGQAQTGTGKTAAFLIPLLERVDQCEPGDDPVALIIVPTRELAVQVRDEGLKLAKNRECDIVAVYGGKPIADQIKKLRAGVDIAVGTPGRIIDLVSRHALNFNSLRWVILDEADRMLDIGFRPDIEKILRQTPKNRQTLLFSATLPDSVIYLAKKYMTDPETCDFSANEIASETIEQYYISVDRERKFDALIRLLEVEKPTQAIVFCRTKRAVDRIGHHLAGVMQGTGMIHGDLSQEARDRMMRDFRSGKVRILVATDVVGRGIDISGISHIINYDIPQFCDDYVHRVGRTGRMGREGIAFTLVTSEEGAELTRIEKRINLQLKRRELPNFVAYTKPVHETEEEKPAPKPVFGSSRRTIRRAL